MKLRCKPGDIAIILRDCPGCEANIGKLVEVVAPSDYVQEGAEGVQCWRIVQVHQDYFWYVTERDGTITKEIITYWSGVSHPDTWLMPIRPLADDDGLLAEHAKCNEFALQEM